MSTVVETEGLTKHYGPVVAVESLNLRLQAGEVFGLLGPNGSGKTTTILMLLGLTEPTGGWARVLGEDPLRNPLAVKRGVGYLPDSVGFYDEMTARENLWYTARLNSISRAEAEVRIDEVVENAGLSEVVDRAVGTYSRGMRQRLGLAEVMMKRPQVAILDEPTMGLDPEAAIEFLGQIRGLRSAGITVLLSSHHLQQVQAVCDRVGLFHKGRMVLEGSVSSLSDKVLGGSYRIEVEATGVDLEKAVGGVKGVVRVSQVRLGSWLVESQHDCRGEVARQVVAHGGSLLGLTLERASLDDVYARYFQEARYEA